MPTHSEPYGVIGRSYLANNSFIVIQIFYKSDNNDKIALYNVAVILASYYKLLREVFTVLFAAVAGSQRIKHATEVVLPNCGFVGRFFLLLLFIRLTKCSFLVPGEYEEEVQSRAAEPSPAHLCVRRVR